MDRLAVVGSHEGEVGASMFRDRVVAAATAALVSGLAVPAIAGDAQTALTCTNPASGASWQITIDYDQATVDSHPAKITPDGISWFAPEDGGNYVLERKSGKLTASVASSTGGYFRHGRCTLEKAR